MAQTPSTAEAKRLWLQAVRQHAGLTVTEFAERMDWNRSDASAMFNGTGGRGIPDDKVDEVVAEFKLRPPMATGILGPSVDLGGLTPEKIEEFLGQGRTVSRLLNLVLDKVESIEKKAEEREHPAQNG